MEKKFKKIKEIVEKELSCSAHNMDHVMRVYNLCLHLAENRKIDMDVLKASALLHDIARVKEDSDSTGKTDHAILSSKMAIPILKKLGFSDDKVEHIKNCIISHRYRTGNEPKTEEAKILFDADKLDALGAIGTARGFVWVGRNDAKIYAKTNIKKYIRKNLGGHVNGRIQDKTQHSPQVEFETKFKYIPNKLFTRKGKMIGKKRLKFMQEFFERMEKEVNGEL